MPFRPLSPRVFGRYSKVTQGPQQTTELSAGGLYWRLTIRAQLLTLGVFIPFIGYFFLLIGGLAEKQMIDFVLCLAYAGLQDFVIHTLARRYRLLPILEQLQPKTPLAEIRQLKIRLLNYPFFEAWLAPIRWYIGMLTLYLVFVSRHQVSTIFIANLFLLPTAGATIAWYCFFTLTESSLAALQGQKQLSSVSVSPKTHRNLPFSGRFMLSTLGLTIITIYFFSYLLHVPAANKVFQAHPWAHSVGSIGAMLLFAVYASYLSHSTFRPALLETTTAIEAIAGGKLSVDVPQFGAHDISRIGYLINNQAGRLREVVGRVCAEAQALSSGAAQLEEEARNLAQEASEQSESVQQVSQQIREITAAVVEAKHSMADTVQAIETGFNAISEVSEKMSEIEKQSLEIEESVGVIDGISRQVNLLALNATIEAARAGAEGRGFVVVADEISKLSDQTKDNSKRIRESVQSAGVRSKKGKIAVAHASEQFEKISQYSGQNAHQIDKIAEASGAELASGITQITGVTDKVVASSRHVEILSNDFKEKSVALEQIARYFD